jgi:hypothetical protein
MQGWIAVQRAALASARVQPQVASRVARSLQESRWGLRNQQHRQAAQAATVQKASAAVEQSPGPQWLAPLHPALTSLTGMLRPNRASSARSRNRHSKTMIPAVIQRYQQPDIYLSVPLEPLYADLHVYHRCARNRRNSLTFCGPLYNLIVYTDEAALSAVQNGSAQPLDHCYRAVLRQLQIDPVNMLPIHAGFYAVDVSGVLHPRGFRMRLPVRPTDLEECPDLQLGFVNWIVRAIDVFVERDVIPPPFLAISVARMRLEERRYGRDICCPPGIRLAHGIEDLLILKLNRSARTRSGS